MILIEINFFFLFAFGKNEWAKCLKKSLNKKRIRSESKHYILKMFRSRLDLNNMPGIDRIDNEKNFKPLSQLLMPAISNRLPQHSNFGFQKEYGIKRMVQLN